jgi:hypothetical protein
VVEMVSRTSSIYLIDFFHRVAIGRIIGGPRSEWDERPIQTDRCCGVATCCVAADERPIQTDPCRPPRTSGPTSHSRRSCGFRWMAKRWKGFFWLGKLAPCRSLN